MKIEISIEKEGKHGKDKPEDGEMMDEQKMAIGKKLKKNIVLTRMERKMIADYLMKEDD